MKKLFLYITLLLSFTSCEKYLEVKLSNILALKTYDDVKSLLGSHLKLYTTTSTGAHKLTGTNVPWRASDLYLFFGFYSDDLNTDTWLNGNWIANNKRALYTNSLNWQNTTMPGTIWGTISVISVFIIRLSTNWRMSVLHRKKKISSNRKPVF